MARPIKSGMDYFSHDTDAAGDEKIEALMLAHGPVGYTFYFVLLERIYRTENGELNVSEAETRQILARKMFITVQEFDNILPTALKKGCFDQGIYQEKGVLTSQGIKKRYETINRKRLNNRGNKVSEAETKQKPGNNSTETPESKVKESKVKQRKKPKTFSSDSDEIRLSELLLSLILSRKPDYKKPNIQTWAKEVDGMIRLDNRPRDRIEKLIRWVQIDAFEQNNVLSTGKLRERFDYLEMKMNSGGKPNGKLYVERQEEYDKRKYAEVLGKT